MTFDKDQHHSTSTADEDHRERHKSAYNPRPQTSDPVATHSGTDSSVLHVTPCQAGVDQYGKDRDEEEAEFDQSSISREPEVPSSDGRISVFD